ncbi:MAG: nitrilase-related carbon-nitrogen hydrolase [Phycisphaerae bacterium]|nr:nitrilase-related carbon-nitrogen hydrolase [Phycisphaerae bacterium]
MPDRYYAATCQTSFACPRTRDEIHERVTRMIAMVEQTLAGYEPFFDVRLFAFPEFAHAAPTYLTVEELDRHLAIELPNEHTDRYAKLCAKHGIWIQTGTFIERNRKAPGRLFNTTALIGPSGVLSLYRKVNPWIPWEVHASPHDAPELGEDPFPVTDTEIGKLGVAICYDWLFPEAIRQIAFNGCEVAIRVSAYMDPWGATPPMDWWTLFNRARAVENTMFVVASNQGATLEGYPPFSWPGGSMVVDYDGRVLAQADAGPGEKVVVAPIDLAALRAERARRVGHDMRGHLRSEMFPYLAKSMLQPARGEISIESIRQRIASAKERLDER